MSRLLRCFAYYFAFVFVLILGSNAFAAGYSCPTYKQYTSCVEGYYMTESSTSSTYNGTPKPGNACRLCSVYGSNYTCAGGTAAPKLNSVTITLNKNGGTGTCGGATTTTAGAQTCTPGSTCTLPSWNSTSCNITNGNKIFKGWSTNSSATSGVTSITAPTSNATYYAVWVTPTCSATNGTCTITAPSGNAPRATITCSTGYSQSGGSNTTSSFTATGSAGGTSVSGSCSAKCNAITFNATTNGGTGGQTATLYKLTGSASWYTNNTCTTATTAAVTKPTKTNAAFGGYYNTSATSGGTQFVTAAGALSTTATVSAATTLYARYTCNTGYVKDGTTIAGACAANTYTVAYNANGGSGTTSNSSHTYGVPKALTANGFTNGTKRFLGWSTSSTATSATYTNGQSVSNLTTANGATVTLYAVWGTCTACSTTHATCTLTAPLGVCTYATSCNTGYSGGTANTYNHTCTANTYTVTLNDNGGSGGIGTAKEVYATKWTNSSGTTITSVTKPTRNGGVITYNANSGSVSPSSVTSSYTFNGYYTATSGGTQRIPATGALPSNTTFTANTTLYAQWSCATTLPTPTRNGYSFNGWYTAASGGTKIGNAGATYCPGSNTTIYAQWTPNVYTITLNKNSSATNGTATVYEKYGVGYSLTNFGSTVTSITVPTVTTGYTFRGYYTTQKSDVSSNDSTGTQRITKSGTLPGNTTFAANTTLYAAWAKNCTVPSHGSCTLTVAENGAVTYTTSCNAGYTISGNGTATPTCTANTNTITLNKNGGTGTCGGQSSTTNGSFTCQTGSSSNLPSWNSSSCNITKTNNVFTGWGTTNNATSAVANAFTCPTSNATYYAVWKTPTCNKGTNVSAASLSSVNSSNQPVCSCTCADGYSQSGGTNAITTFTTTGGAGATSVTCTACSARSYTISYALNSGTQASSGVPTSYTYGTGATINGTPRRDGYTFEGWCTDSALTSCAKTQTISTTATGNKTFYAKWSINATVTNPSKTYDGSALTCAGVSGTPSGATIKYGTASGTYNLTSAPTRTDAGTTTVYYQITATNAVTKTGSFSCTVNKANCSITVKDGSTTVASGGTVTLTYPSAKTLTATSSSGATVSFTSGTTANVTVSGKTLTPVKVGTSAITATSAATTNYNACTQTFTASVAAGTISATASNKTLTYNGTTTSNGTAQSCANVTVTAPTSGATVTYCDSAYKNCAAASSTNTNSTLTNAGSKTIYYQITATNYTTKTGNYTCTMGAKAMTVSSSNKTLTYSGSAQSCGGNVTVTTPSSGATVTYSATSDGTYSANAPTLTNAGSTTVYYKVTGSNFTEKTGSYTCTMNKAACTLAVSATSGSTAFPTAKTFTISGAKGTATVSSSATGVATAAISGTTVTMTPKATGNATITVTDPGNANYNGCSKTYDLTVAAGTITVKETNPSKVYNGSALTCSGVTVTAPSSGATIKYGTTSGTYNLTSAPTRTDAGTTTVYYQITAANYTTKTGSFTCSVTQADNTITLSANSGSMAYSSTATFTVSNAQGAVTVSSSDTNVATVAISGTTVTITSKAAYGTATITVTAAGNTNYKSGSKTYALTVNKGTISLNNQSATSAGTTAVYQTYNTNVYLDSARSKAMTTSANGITVPAKTGYAFGGYYDTTSYANQYIAANGFITSAGLTAGKALKANGTWYAKWTANTYTVTYKAGTGGSGADTTQSVTYNASFTTKAANTFSKANATFAGWSPSSGGYTKASTQYTYTTVGNVTLTATWNCDAGYTLNSTTGACDPCASGTYKTAAGNGACSACSALTAKPATTDGTYSSVSPFNAATTCRYTAKAKTITGCKTVTNNTVSYNGSSWGTNLYSVTANGGYVIANNNSATATCTQCGAGKFSAGGTETSCGSCPAADTGWTMSSATGLSTVTQCTETTTPTISGSPIATICTAGTLTKKATSINAWGDATASGLTAKAGRYVNGTTCSACAAGTYTSAASTATSCTAASKGYYVSGTEQTAQSACAAGTYTSATGQSKCTDAVAGTYTTGCQITASNTACTGTSVCANNTWSGAKASSCTACTTAKGYGNSGTTAAAHNGIASCKVTCGGGKYVATAGAGCVDVGIGYWGAGGTVAENATLARNQCAAGLTTIGSGAGADEAADCGRVLHVGDGKLYLRSVKKTTPSLNININGTTFYGNMTEGTSKGSLRINSGGKTYSVHDDSM